jgi:hypothetical protein
VIAENMKRDVPDAALTVLGHTDAIGSDAYNIDLSRRRAEAVMRALVARGVNPDQLSEVAIGKRQPIAPNDTAEGRALNRRVEFMISPALSANLAAVQQRFVPARYFEIGLAPPKIYKLQPNTPGPQSPDGDQAPLVPVGQLPPAPRVSPEGPEQIQPALPAPSPHVTLRPPEQVIPRPLGPSTAY